MNVFKKREELVKKTWESFYPDRRPWDKMSHETRQEYIAFFEEYEKHKEIMYTGIAWNKTAD
jgi:hypothetical protein